MLSRATTHGPSDGAEDPKAALAAPRAPRRGPEMTPGREAPDCTFKLISSTCLVYIYIYIYVHNSTPWRCVFVVSIF